MKDERDDATEVPAPDDPTIEVGVERTEAIDRSEIEAEAAEAEAAEADDTEVTDTPGPEVDDTAAEDPGPARVLEEFGAEVRRGVVTHGWDRAALAAAVGFAALLAMGAVLVLMAKLVLPGLGSDNGPVWFFERIVIAGLASIGIPVERGATTSSVLIIGSLLFIGWMLSWATRKIVASSGAMSVRERVAEGIKVAVPFALFCFIAALLFKAEDARPALSVGALGALVIGLIWGALFGAIGGLRAHGIGSLSDDARLWLRDRSMLRSGVVLGASMLKWLALLSSVALLAVLVIKLVFGDVTSLSAGEAVAFALALLLFFPNLVLGTAAFSLGAPIAVLARTIDGTNAVSETSLFGWGADLAPVYAFVMLLIPLAAFAYAGYRASANRENPPIEVLGTAAGVVAIVMLLAVWVTRVRIGAAFLGEGQFLVATAAPLATFVLGALWAIAGGYLGWRLGSGGSTKSG